MLFVYLPAVFSYSVLEITHDTLHFLADHYHSTLHHHTHDHDHQLSDHHVHTHSPHSHPHVHIAAESHDDEATEANLNKVFYPISYLESGFCFTFINTFSMIARWKHILPLTSLEQTPPNPPPQDPRA